MKTSKLYSYSIILLLTLFAVLPLSAKDYEPIKPILVQAIFDKDTASARFAINNGADINELYDNDTPLIWAIRKDQPEIVKLIIQSPNLKINTYGTYIDTISTDEWKRPALIIAAHMGQAETVDLLLKNGANINAIDTINGGKRDTALIKATRRNHVDVVKVLLNNEKKPDLNIKDSDGTTALWIASEKEYIDLVKLLFKSGSKINTTDSSGRSILTTTMSHNDFAVLDFLVQNGADINLVDKMGYTPLMTFVRARNDSSPILGHVAKLLSYKPKLDFEQIKTEGGGHSALHEAAIGGSVELAKLLLDSGANIDIASLTTGGTPLHTAASWNFPDVTSYLIERGANLEIVSFKGATPLIVAAQGLRLDNVKCLVKGGAIIDVKTSKGTLTPLIAATRNIDPTKHANSISIMKFLLDNKADINFPGGDGRTPLMNAAASSDLILSFEKVTLLLTRGAKLDLADNKGETALMLAAGTGNYRVVKLLLDKGARFDQKNGAGETVMSYADRSGKNTINKLLESKGAVADVPIERENIVIDELVGTWQGFHDDIPQALYTIILNKDSTFDFNSRLTPEALKQYPAGSINPVIAEQKGTYTFEKDTMIWNLVGGAPTSFKWKLEKNMLIIDSKIRLKKTK